MSVQGSAPWGVEEGERGVEKRGERVGREEDEVYTHAWGYHRSALNHGHKADFIAIRKQEKNLHLMYRYSHICYCSGGEPAYMYIHVHSVRVGPDKPAIPGQRMFRAS